MTKSKYNSHISKLVSQLKNEFALRDLSKVNYFLEPDVFRTVSPFQLS